MIKWLKKYFVPHSGNDHRPHLFQKASVLFLFGIVLILFVMAISSHFIITRTNLTALVLPKVLVDYTNENRLAKNYGGLTINPLLEKAAELKANDMAEKGYFAHKSPEGHSPWYWFKTVGYEFSYAGENLAINFSESSDISNAWMNSEGHRDNILNKNFSEIGIATAEGSYQGKKTIFVVQLFGTKSEKEPLLAQTTVSTTTRIIKNTKTSEKIATTSAVVLSESIDLETFTKNNQNEMFVFTGKNSTVSDPFSTKKNSNFIERAILSPSKSLGFIYLIIAIIIFIGLIFLISVGLQKLHPPYILIAIGLLFIISGLFYFYKRMFFISTIVI